MDLDSALRALEHARASGALSAREWAELEDAVLHALRNLQMRAYSAEVEARRLRADLAEVRGALRTL